MLTANVVVKEKSFDFLNETKGLLCVVADPDTSAKLSENYFSNFDRKPFESIKRAVEVSLKKNIVCAAYFEGVIYFASFGASEVSLMRNGEVRVILSPSDNLQSASGFPKEGDLISLKTEEGKISLKFEKSRRFNFNLPVNLKNKIYLRSQDDQKISPDSKRMTLFLGISLLVLVISLSVIGINKSRRENLREKYEGILENVETNINRAISLATSDPEKSRELFKLAESDLKRIEELDVKDKDVSSVKEKIDTSRESILGEYKKESELFLDLSLLSSGFKGSQIALTEGKAYVLDKEGKKIISVETSTKKSKVVAGPSVIEESFDLASYENTVYILDGQGINQVDSSKKRVIEKTWGGDALIKMFGGNMYVLSKSDNQIFRFTSVGQNFSEKQNWLSSSTGVDFSNAQSMGIDGAVYVLYPNSKILKFSQGSPQSFRISGIVPEIGSVDALFADPNNNYLYLLDKAGKRVVVTDKKGSYKAQYFDEKIGETSGLVVSEADKKIILLAGEKLLQIEIEH